MHIYFLPCILLTILNIVHVLAPPPPPYQETLPENHTYKSGTRIVPTMRRIEATLSNHLEVHLYEYAYCHNMILPMSVDGSSGELGSLSQALPAGPSTRNKFWDIWRQLTKRNKSKKGMKIKTATLKRCSSQHNVSKVKTATLKRNISNHKILKQKCCSSEAPFLSKNYAFSGQLNSVQVLSPEIKDEDCYFKFPCTYTANDYVFTKL